MRTALVLALTVCSISFANISEAAASTSGRSAPLAYQLFCLKSPADCRGGGRQHVDLSTKTLAKLNSVNRAVNSKMRARNDGSADSWTIGATSGDCEDFALSKRRRLIQLGLPSSALRMAVVRTRRGEGHAVLVVRTSKGDRILDNRTNSIKSWHQSDLRLVSMATANPLKWR